MSDASAITIAAIIDSSGATAGARAFNNALGSMRSGVATTGSIVRSFASQIFSVQGALVGLAGAFSSKEFIQAGDTFAMTKSRLALFAQEGVTATSILDALTAAAQRSNAPVGALADIYSRNAAALNNLKISTSDQVRLNETLYKALVVSGNATQSGKEALIQFSQSLNSGVFRGQEFNSVNEQATEIIRILSRETGKTQGELRKLANDGMLTAEVAVSGVLNGGGSGGFDIGGMFSGLFGAGGDVGLGSWAPTVTAFASGGIVDKPTNFAFNGGMGVAGEDGPEAIIPLRRGPNGSLGVSASGMGGSNVTNVAITITGDATEATIAKMYQAAEQMFAKNAPGLINDAAGEVAKRYRNNRNYLVR
ncbi:tape measure protein [Hyphomicrobium sp.]|uniref:tape measure protein n=1 Tax=Hyphomicrobium sp. TaxID=82 RepID=UPI001D712D12|nr:tape measure protein [Hyphomicrobium sp.]MBY0561973.1 tape measure protein [Hyphomicrobium sp.]